MSRDVNSDQVPITDLPDNDRINVLKDYFYKEFHRKPLFFVRVPGRVNLIGEHIDYCGYPVLPMALELDILIAAGITKKPEIHIRNLNRKYNDYNGDLTCGDGLKIIPDPNGKPFWYNYVLCGIKGGLEYINDELIYGLQLCVDGNIPPASGLSSSSALVSAACLAFLYAQNSPLSKTKIASLCANSERYIGTQGGGMDQAIAFLAQKFSAQYITWQPLRAAPVALPENAAFVVAHSLAEANKAATNDFNLRVIECRLAAKVITSCAGAATDKEIITLSETQKILDKNLEEMVQLVFTYLPNESYSKSEIAHILKVDESELEEIYFTTNTRHITELKLKQRALHVYREAIRVEEFRKHCTKSTLNGNANINNIANNREETNDILRTLGGLISGSHESLKTLYECSHENLDRLVELSMEMDVHSRLTGAGWGGCIIALCAKENVEEYINTLVENFYVKHCNIDRNEARSYVFATKPNHGAEIYINV